MSIKVIITGATGMVGEGVLLECLSNPEVSDVLMVNRKSFDLRHPKLRELIVPDFFRLEDFAEQLKGYDACFFCAGISSVGMDEPQFTRITYDTTIHFATVLCSVNSGMVFTYVSGRGTDSTEMGKLMWARVKGKTENDLMKLPFKAVYNFRPGFMKPTPGQKNVKATYKIIGGLYPLWKLIIPNWTSKLSGVGRAMIQCVLKGAPKKILEVRDINAIANGN